MQPRSLLKGFAAASTAVVVLLTVAAIWLLRLSPLGLLHQSATLPEIVQLVPRQSIGFVALAAPLPRLERLRRFATPLGDRRRARREWQRYFSAAGQGPLAEFLQAAQVDFDREILPWLGDESLVMGLEASSERPDYAIALSTRDLDRSNFLLNLLWQRQYLQRATDPIETYKGVQILTVTDGDRSWAVAAVGDRYVLFATSARGVREAIDSWQVPRLSIVSNPQYRATVAQLEGDRVGLAYLNLAAIAQATDFWPAWNTPNGPLSGLALGLGIERQGLVLETSLHATVPKTIAPRDKTENSSLSTFSALPDNTLAAVIGYDLQQAWRSLQYSFDASPLPNPLVQSLAPLEAETQLDWQQDLFSWMRQAFAIALLPSGNHYTWLLAADIDRANPAAIAAFEAKLRDLGIQPISVPLSNSKWGEAIAWVPVPDFEGESDSSSREATSNAATAIAYRLQRGNTVYLSPSLSAIEQALSRPSLSRSPEFKSLARSLPRSDRGYLYARGAELARQKPNWEEAIAPIPFTDRLEAVLLALAETAIAPEASEVVPLKTGAVPVVQNAKIVIKPN
ncbi:DUF3352 domain-containing protein [Synechococcus sp. PCC 7336]|uniref:DUF3352 domain-containing protein n=1 Tax=Synechococcus sp. PCC 7336 TaxID=195250 RepID=UPI00034592A4|nr:DUF3352 domain-containing protein [Synechococcus sp. PCC 7336]